VRDIEAILQREEDLQAIEEQATAAAVEQEALDNLAQDACDISSVPHLDLCSTTELMEVFTEYYDGDAEDMAKSKHRVSGDVIEANIDINAQEFDLDFSGKEFTLELPNMDFGNNTEGFDIDELLRTA